MVSQKTLLIAVLVTTLVAFLAVMSISVVTGLLTTIKTVPSSGTINQGSAIPTVAWVHSLSASIYSSPVVSEGVVYVGADDHAVHAINATNGVSIWDFTTDGSIVSTPAIGQAGVYFGSLDGKVYAVNKTTGLQVWNFTTGDSVYSSPTIIGSPGIVYVGSDDGYLYALNASSGAEVWSFTGHSGRIDQSPATVNGAVYFGSSGSVFYALNATTGEELWTYNTARVVFDFHSHQWYTIYYVPTSAAVADDIVHFGTQDLNNPADGQAYALNATDGTEIWDNAAAENTTSCPAIALGVAYFGSTDGNLDAFDSSTGDFLWSYSVSEPIVSSPVVASGAVYFGGTDNTIYSLAATTGLQIWSFKVSNTLETGIAVDNAKLFFATSDPAIYAIIIN